MGSFKFKTVLEGVYKILPDGTEERISDYMEIIKLTYNLDTFEFKAVIRFYSLAGIHEIVVDRSTYLNKNKLLELMNKGIDVTYDNVSDLVKFFKNEELRNANNIENVHQSLGFSIYNNNIIYKLGTAIGCQSTYAGEMDIGISGSKEEYFDMFKKEVLGNCALELAASAGVSAITQGFIGDEIGGESLVINLRGNSSTGKTTALKLAISAFSSPDVKKNGLLGTYNGTNNALLNKLSGLKGVPFAFDEISLSTNENFTKFIYTLANGTDKERLNKKAELTKKGTWLTTILSNGERSLLDSSNKNAGLQVRVIEITNLKWTSSAGNAEKINETILRTHGHLALSFAEKITEWGKEYVLQIYRDTREDIYKTFKTLGIIDNFTERRVGKYAILLTTALILQEVLDVELDMDGIEQIFIDVEKVSIQKRNFERSAIDYIKQYISKFQHKFSTEGNNNPNHETYGKLTKKVDYIELQMDKLSFDSMLREGGFEDKNVVLKVLKNNELLDAESDRFTRSRLDNLGIKQDFYVIKLKD